MRDGRPLKIGREAAEKRGRGGAEVGGEGAIAGAPIFLDVGALVKKTGAANAADAVRGRGGADIGRLDIGGLALAN